MKSVAGEAEKDMTVTISDMQRDEVYPNSGNRRPVLGNFGKIPLDFKMKRMEFDDST